MPFGAIFGPKTKLINENAGSGGDAMPYYFLKMGVGPLIGKRTWGGLVRSDPMPVLIDGGIVTAPPVGIWSEKANGWPRTEASLPIWKWIRTPRGGAGRDPKLTPGVAYLLEELKMHPATEYKRPAYSACPSSAYPRCMQVISGLSRRSS